MKQKLCNSYLKCKGDQLETKKEPTEVSSFWNYET
jgi:hypothetical protein